MSKPEMTDIEKMINRTGYAHVAFSVGSKERVDELIFRLRADGFSVISGPRTTGDGYYESCIVAIEGNQKYEEFRQYQYNKVHGYIWMPDTLELICRGNEYDPEKKDG